MAQNNEQSLLTTKCKLPFFVFFKDARLVFKLDDLAREILGIALPAALALAADPVASIIDTAFIGHIGAVELGAVGVSIALFNQVSKVTIFPLVSITTSFVAEEETVERAAALAARKESADGVCTEPLKNETLENDSAKKAETKGKTEDAVLDNMEKGSVGNTEMKESTNDEPKGSTNRTPLVTEGNTKGELKRLKRNIPSASTALIFGAALGILQTVFLILGAKILLRLMNVKPGSPMLDPAMRYLTLRSLGAPAVLLSLAMQGIFRGFKDTKTPLYAIVAADVTNIILDPIFIFALRMGVTGAAIAHVLSQYLMSILLFLKLMRQVKLLPPSFKDLQFGRFIKNGVPLLARVVAVTFCVTLAASLASNMGPTPMAAFQICLQVWMTSSLLADGLAVAGQAILASSFAEKDYKKTAAAATRVLQMSFILGLGLALLVGIGLRFGSGIFTKDVSVQHLIFIGIPFIAATQPINVLAFVFDGVNFGASDFTYTAYSMVLVSVVTVVSLFLLSKSNGFVGIWIALTIYMVLRAFAGTWRMGTGTGPWRFLRG